MIPAGAQAQVDVRLGPRLGVDFGDVEEAFVGADARIDAAVLPVTVNPALDVYFVDEGSFWSLSGNALYTFPVGVQVLDPYVGAGFGIYRFSNGVSSTDLGLNFLLGTEFQVGGVRPFAELQVSPIFREDSVNLFSLKGGVLFSL